MYDSLFKRLDVETRNTIMKMFGLKKSNEIIMIPMQEQEGSKDCGPFSIAVMTSLAYEDDPSEIRYKQLDLRQHLIATLFCKRRACMLSKGIMHTHAGILYSSIHISN